MNTDNNQTTETPPRKWRVTFVNAGLERELVLVGATIPAMLQAMGDDAALVTAVRLDDGSPIK